MCEIFPEVEKCCFLISLRLGCLFISVLSIMSGVITLSTVEKISDASYNNLKNVTEIVDPYVAFANLSSLITVGVIGMSLVYILTGFILIFAIITDQEGFVQIFVWITFLAIAAGYLLDAAIAVECVVKKPCTLRGMDWLSGSAVLVAICCYLGVWFYFICVANTFVVNGG